MTDLRRRRGSRRESEAPERGEDELIGELRRRAWAWLGGHRAPVETTPVALESAPPANDAVDEGSRPRKRGKREPVADGGAALRRKAWTWLQAPAEAPAKKKRAPRREPAAPTADGGTALRRKAWSWLQAPTEAPAKKKRAPRREPAAPTSDASATLRRKAWSWLKAPAEAPAEAPAKKKRAPRREPAAPTSDGGAALRRKAWSWLKAPAEAPAKPPPEAPAKPPAPVEPEAPKRRRARREAAVPEGVVALRRRAWAWFAPRATGEAAAGTHGPVRVAAPSPDSGGEVVRAHLKGVLEALIFAAEHALPARELARIAQADLKLVKTLLAELVAEYQPRGMRLDEVAGGYVFRTSPVFAPFVREQVAKKPVKMSRAQIETLAIVAYRQPTTRPEIDDVRGVDSGAVLKSLLERELVRIIGKKDEPGRPLLYGTTAAFLEFFGLRALGDLPTLREFTELSDDSKRAYEREMGEEPLEAGDVGLMGGEGELRRQTKVEAPVVDTAALEEDPTLAPEAADGERAAPEEGAPETEPQVEAEPQVEPEVETEPQVESEGETEPQAETEGEDEKDEDEDDEDDEDEDEDDEDDEDEDDEDEDEDED